MTERDPVLQQIHGFSDASEKTYATVIYLRSTYDNARVNVCIIASKARVVPVKTQTIPRLELLGATILSHLIHNVCIVIFLLNQMPAVGPITDYTVFDKKQLPLKAKTEYRRSTN